MRPAESEQASRGIRKKNRVINGYRAPKVLYDDGIDVQTTDPMASNVALDLI